MARSSEEKVGAEPPPREHDAELCAACTRRHALIASSNRVPNLRLTNFSGVG